MHIGAFIECSAMITDTNITIPAISKNCAFISWDVLILTYNSAQLFTVQQLLYSLCWIYNTMIIWCFWSVNFLYVVLYMGMTLPPSLKAVRPFIYQLWFVIELQPLWHADGSNKLTLWPWPMMFCSRIFTAYGTAHAPYCQQVSSLKAVCLKVMAIFLSGHCVDLWPQLYNFSMWRTLC